MFSAGVDVPRRSGVRVGLFPAPGTRKSGRTLIRLIMLIVIILSIVGLWTTAGLAQRAVAGGAAAPVARMEPAGG